MDESSCSHHWIIEPPHGPWSLATCRKCKKIDAFKNALEESGWSPTPPKREFSKTKSNKSITTKEEFLTQRKPQPIQSNGSKYKTEFKLRIVQEVSIYGRTKIRKKYGLPETTLRAWVKRYT